MSLIYSHQKIETYLRLSAFNQKYLKKYKLRLLSLNDSTRDISCHSPGLWNSVRLSLYFNFRVVKSCCLYIFIKSTFFINYIF